MTRAPALPPRARAILSGDRRALAQLISGVENRDPKVVPTLSALYPHTGLATIVGITGPLGVGKSSLVNGLLHLLRDAGKSVGVVAVDPSSPFSGGSVLGDRVRLDRKPGDAGVFIRSMASRGHVGGLAAATREVTRLLDAFGLNVVLVETVGSGQVDLEIHDVASTSVVVVVPHLGDEVQTMKAGLFEIADVFCVNKSDLPGADAAARDLAALASLGADRLGWRPAVVTASATTSVGVGDLWARIADHERFLDQNDQREKLSRLRLEKEIVGLVQERVGEELRVRVQTDPELEPIMKRVLAKSLDPYGAADQLYREFRRAD